MGKICFIKGTLFSAGVDTQKCGKKLMKLGEAWSLTMREERKLRVFENMVLRRIFVRVIKSRRMRWVRHVGAYG